MFSRIIISFLLLVYVQAVQGQDEIFHVEPPHWWYDMENPYLELLIHGDNISGLTPKVSSKKVKVLRTTPGDSDNYLFLGLDISALDEQSTITITLKGRGRKIKIPYTLYPKRSGDKRSQGIHAKDAIYLITPDRFCNGNPNNDAIIEYKEGPNRQDEYGRHGGDLEGIIQSLDYIKDLGFNSIWLNPVLENDMASQSYHGYATTDYYAVDKRFGGNAMYENLRQELETKDMNLIMDMIANHCGSFHWWMEDLPFDDWLNFQEKYSQHQASFAEYSNHRKTTVLDPYASKVDRQQMVDGWFVKTMPDLNQRNVHMATYIIQNSIWWVETMNLAGIRQDTYSYPDEHFLSDWSCSLQEEYPNLFIVGEEWTDNPLIAAYWQAKENRQVNQYLAESCLPSVMDFPMQMTVSKALTDPETWNTGFPKMYELMVNDRMYPDPSKLVIFPDNHDMDRVFTQMNEDFDLWKMAMVYYATMRGIPQIYYGTEVLMSHPGTSSHGAIREEFKGGWPDHDKNYFEQTGMSDRAIEAQNFTSKLFNWRQSTPVIHTGKLIHFAPQEGVYVFARYLDDQQVLVIFNKNNSVKTIALDRFDEILQDYDTIENVMTSETITLRETLAIPSRSVQLYQMSK